MISPIRLKHSARFTKSLAKIGEPIASRAASAIKRFYATPNSPGLNFEAVKGCPGMFTIRVGRNFRILLKAEEDEEGPYYLLAERSRVKAKTPPVARVCTSHVERLNLHVRMMSRRFTRLATGFSRKRANLRATVALFAASYNFTWMHRSIRMTPAMKVGIARAPWTVRDLLTSSAVAVVEVVVAPSEPLVA